MFFLKRLMIKNRKWIYTHNLTTRRMWLVCSYKKRTKESRRGRDDSTKPASAFGASRLLQLPFPVHFLFESFYLLWPQKWDNQVNSFTDTVCKLKTIKLEIKTLNIHMLWALWHPFHWFSDFLFASWLCFTINKTENFHWVQSNDAGLAFTQLQNCLEM